MNRYSEDTSTSSEDDTSTAEAGAVSTTTTTITADMCRSEVRKGVKVQRCTGCGYTSDRRANVTRHYRRIHLLLKKRRECPLCGEVFETKWEFYEHCDEFHPKMRQSWYTTTQVYKMKQTKAKSKLKAVSRPSRRVESSKEKVILPRVTRSTTSLKSQKVLSTSCSSVKVGPSMITAASFSSSGSGSADEVAPMTSAESYSSSCSSENDSPLKKVNQSFDSYMTNDENAAPRMDIAHLPIKKRYLTERRVLANITNNNVVNSYNRSSSNCNMVQMSDRDLYLAKLDEKQKYHMGDINFDELDAMLQLHYMKRNI